MLPGLATILQNFVGRVGGIQPDVIKVTDPTNLLRVNSFSWIRGAFIQSVALVNYQNFEIVDSVLLLPLF